MLTNAWRMVIDRWRKRRRPPCDMCTQLAAESAKIAAHAVRLAAEQAESDRRAAVVNVKGEMHLASTRCLCCRAWEHGALAAARYIRTGELLIDEHGPVAAHRLDRFEVQCATPLLNVDENDIPFPPAPASSTERTH